MENIAIFRTIIESDCIIVLAKDENGTGIASADAKNDETDRTISMEFYSNRIEESIEESPITEDGGLWGSLAETCTIWYEDYDNLVIGRDNEAIIERMKDWLVVSTEHITWVEDNTLGAEYFPEED